MRFITVLAVLPLVAAFSLVTAVTATPARAQITNIPISNFSFELTDVADNSVSSVVPNWTRSGGAGGVFDPGNGQYAGATGNNAALPGTAHGGQLGYINSVGSFTSDAVTTSTASTLYTLTVALGNKLNDNPTLATIELLANNLVVASASATNATLPEGTFIDLSTSYTALASGQVLVVRLNHSGGGQINYDNVRLSATAVAVNAEVAPEPASLALFAFIGGGAAFVSRRRDRKRG